MNKNENEVKKHCISKSFAKYAASDVDYLCSGVPRLFFTGFDNFPFNLKFVSVPNQKKTCFTYESLFIFLSKLNNVIRKKLAIDLSYK